MIESETRIIGGRDTSTTQFPALTAAKLLISVGKVVGPALAQILSDAEVMSSIMETNVSQLSSVVTEFFFSVDPDRTVILIQQLLRNTSVVVDGARLELNSEQNINTAFTGNRLRYLAETVKFVLEVNYRDFIGGVVKQRSAMPSQRVNHSN